MERREAESVGEDVLGGEEYLGRGMWYNARTGPRSEVARRRALRRTLGEGTGRRFASGTLGSGAFEKMDLEGEAGLTAEGKLSVCKFITLEMERFRIDAISNKAFWVSSPTWREGR